MKTAPESLIFKGFGASLAFVAFICLFDGSPPIMSGSSGTSRRGRKAPGDVGKGAEESKAEV